MSFFMLLFFLLYPLLSIFSSFFVPLSSTLSLFFFRFICPQFLSFFNLHIIPAAI